MLTVGGMDSGYVLPGLDGPDRTLVPMATAPYGIRLLVGVAVTAIEETRKLPQTIVMYPMTLASTIAQMVMKMQQDLAGFAIKGDAALEMVFPPKDEKPDWATFDEDDQPEADKPSRQRRSCNRGPLRAVLGCRRPDDRPERVPPSNRRSRPSQAPPIAGELDYDSLTLAQLRARIQSLSVTDLRALLAYEESAKARAPFQTLLANRITRATAK